MNSILVNDRLTTSTPYKSRMSLIRGLAYLGYVAVTASSVFLEIDTLPVLLYRPLHFIVYGVSTLYLFCFLYLLVVENYCFDRLSSLFCGFLFFYSIFSLVVILLNFGFPSGLGLAVSEGLLWSSTFVFIYYCVVSFNTLWLIFPFLVSGAVIFFWCVLIYFGMPVEYNVSSSVSVDKGMVEELSLFFSGVFLNRNAFAQFLLFFVFCNLLFYVFAKSKAAKVFSIIFILASLYFMLLTLARSPLLGVAVLLFCLLFAYRYAIRAYLILFGLMVLVSVFLYVNDHLFQLLMQRVTEDGSSGRLEIWMDALAKTAENPWGGVGDYKYNGLSAHNTYLHKLASRGVPVFLIWISIYMFGVFLAIAMLYKKWRYENRKIAFLCASIFLSIIVQQLFETGMAGSFSSTVIFMFFVFSIMINFSFGSRLIFRKRRKGAYVSYVNR